MNTQSMKLTHPLTPEMKENLIAGVLPHQKRVVLHLAEASRIVNPDLTIRVYDDFVDDWRYTHSTFVNKGTCELCGKNNIREACHIEDTHSKDALVVGNECVFTHITIDTDGVEGLTGDAKRDYLRKAMGVAKARWQKEHFQTTYPLAWAIWEKVEPTFDSHDQRWCNRVTKQLTTFGYLKAGTLRDWERIYHTFSYRITEHERKISAGEIYAGRRSRFGAKSALVAHQRIKAATDFRNDAEKKFDDGLLNSYQAGLIGGIESNIRRYGIEGLRYHHQRVYAEIQAVGLPISDELVDEGGVLAVISMKKDKLTDWEQDFLRSVIERNSQGRYASVKQRAVIARLAGKVKTPTPTSW
tara:strand:- start:24831 stop:25898 length:1068 start_codon:yes stop_codon:yes gene_type:complete